MTREAINVLIVEDSPTDAFLAREELRVPGTWGQFEVRHVETLQDAISAAKNHRFDAILLDLQLPDSEGFATFERLQQAVADVSIIVLTGELDESVAHRAVKAGAQDYVVKGQGGLLPRVVRYAVDRTHAQVERRRLEEHFVQVHKMEMVGRLSAGVAHDFNNILSVIMGYNDLILSKLPVGDVTRSHAEEIQFAAERAAGLTRQLLIFSRQETISPTVLDPNESILSLDKMLRRMAGPDIEYRLDLDDQIRPIHMDANFLGQILMNLVVNARDAMPEGGRLTVATRNVVLPQPDAPPSPEANLRGNYVMFSVSDTGCGMDAALQSRMFDAFVTTKGKNHGTGLGLAICQSIVEQSEGCIKVDSAPGEGATFRLYFPALADGTHATGSTATGFEPDDAPINDFAFARLRAGQGNNR